MSALTRVVHTFPSAHIASQSGGLPVEISLIAQLGHGSGDDLYQSVLARQQAHREFVDELDEPSARLAGTDLERGDPTSLYSFAVGPKGHPFHRHAGHRIFTAISGSGGAQLRFSTASLQQMQASPHSFLSALQYVNLPPDCLFTVRFGGGTWHQFAPLSPLHPAFFALSCHTNELGGALSDAAREKVLAGSASIPALTELLPEAVIELLQREQIDPARIPTIALSLDAAPGTLQSAVCSSARASAGLIRGNWSKRRPLGGFLSNNAGRRPVVALKTLPAGSLLLRQFEQERVDHEDTFSLTVSAAAADQDAVALLGALLEGFLINPPVGVSRMMALRNVLVRPLGLRTSPLGCPVSSLLSTPDDRLFAGRYPVLEQATSADGTRSQVILGADDKHLRFRSCVGVELQKDGFIAFTLGNRVHCKNLFGRIYMALIDRTHRAYIAPAMLRLAVDHALADKTKAASAAQWHRNAPVPAA